MTFDGFSLIWYRDGDDCQAFHRDRDMRFTEETLVVILTLGARRLWLLRRRDRREQVDRGARRRRVRPLPRGWRPVRARRARESVIGSTPCPRWRARSRVGRISGQWRWTSGKGRPELGGSYAAPRNFSRR